MMWSKSFRRWSFCCAVKPRDTGIGPDPSLAADLPQVIWAIAQNCCVLMTHENSLTKAT